MPSVSKIRQIPRLYRLSRGSKARPRKSGSSSRLETANVRAFLRFASYYRRHIKDFAKMGRPLYELSENTFVEESDSLKQGAAGAGLTDND